MTPFTPSALHRRIVPVLVIPLVLLLQGCSMMFPPTLRASRVTRLPEIDGSVDPAWASVPALLVLARGNTQEHLSVPVELRAVHDGDHVAMLFRWEDDTPSTSVRQIEWSPAGEPMLQGVPDDQFAVKFNLGGSRFSCMLAGKPVTSDVWSWKAGRTNPSGFAQDRLLIVRAVDESSTAEPAGATYRALNGKPVELVWQEDEGEPLLTAAPTSGTPGTRVSEVTAGIPSGSQADVRAKALWKDGLWTLEVRRKLDTGHADDAVIAAADITKFSLAVFDRSEGPVHANTRSIKLKPLP